MEQGFTYDDIALVPQFNNVPSRTEPLLESWLTRKLKVEIPLLAANMDSVISPPLARLLLEAGTFPIFHRFSSFEEQKKQVEEFAGKAFISCGIAEQKLSEVIELLDRGALGVCIDVAHGHSDRMLHFIGKLKRERPDKEVIAGNVCTPMAYHDLVNAGADAVKVGVGPGAACTTRMVTGFGVPQFTAVYGCGQVAAKLRVPIIADGGIKSSRELILALAAGASTVMMGKCFAMTEESAAPKRDGAKGREAKFRGQASANFQEEFYGALKAKTVAEGVDFWGPVTGSAKELIEDFLGGLRSGLTYGGARSIKELQRKAEFIRVSHTYMHESRPRP